MFIHFLKVGLRNIFRQRLYALINILGLAVAIGSALLIGSYVQYELSFDRFHDKSDRTYMLYYQMNNEAKIWKGTYSYGKDLQQLASENPSIEHMTRVFPSYMPIVYDEKQFTDQQIILADSAFFDVFDFQVLESNRDNLLEEPNTVILSESLAKNIFGEENPLGKSLKLGEGEYLVTGLMADVPTNSHMQFDGVLSFASLENKRNGFKYFANYSCNYVVRKSEVEEVFFQDDVSRSLSEAMQQTGEGRPNVGPEDTVLLEKYTNLHFFTDFDWNPLINAQSKSKVFIFLSIGSLILLLGCINFVIVYTARSTKKSADVGIRKTVGANKIQIISQYYLEVWLMLFMSLLLALPLARLGQKLMLEVSGADFPIHILSWEFLLLAAGILIFISLLAASYPALQLSRFQPVQLFRGNTQKGRNLLRNGLVILQFAISLIMIISTLLVYRQLQFMRDKDLGFDQAQLVSIIGSSQTWGSNINYGEKLKVIQDKLDNSPLFLESSRCSAYPGNLRRNRYDSYQNKAGKDLMVKPIYADRNYLKTLKPFVVQEDSMLRGKASIALNETAARMFELGNNPIGKPLYSSDSIFFPVSALIKDFHFASLKDEIEPLVIMLVPPNDSVQNAYLWRLMVRLAPGKTEEALEVARLAFSEVLPAYEMNHRFVEERFESLYREEDRLLNTFLTFSLLAVLIACLGLFGLAAFAAEQRTKEIGIRKVMGASVRDIVLLMTKDFSRLVVIANVVGIPVAAWLMDQWLENFAFHIGLPWDVFVMGLLISISLAFLTVSFHALKAASMDPITSLRYE